MSDAHASAEYAHVEPTSNAEGVKSVNSVLAALLSTVVGCLLTGILSWLAFGPSSTANVLEQEFVRKSQLVKTVEDSSPWIKDKPYVQGDIERLKSDVRELVSAQKTVVRLEEKIDRVLAEQVDIKKALREVEQKSNAK